MRDSSATVDFRSCMANFVVLKKRSMDMVPPSHKSEMQTCFRSPANPLVVRPFVGHGVLERVGAMTVGHDMGPRPREGSRQLLFLPFGCVEVRK